MTRCERTKVLAKFANNDVFVKKTELDQDKLANIDFTQDSGDLLAEVVKKLVFSYCAGESDITTIRNMNNVIKNSV